MTKKLVQNRGFLLWKSLFVCLLLLLGGFLSSCKRSIDYFDYVSELRENIFLCKTEEFSLRIYAVTKEHPYVMDGVKKELSTRVEAYLVPPEGMQTCHLTFTFEGNEYGGEMSFDNVKTEYYFSCTLDVAQASELPCRITYGEKTLEMTAKSVRSSETLTPQNVLKTLETSEANLFTSLTDEYGFAGEIYVRLIYEDAPYYYVGIIDREKNVHAFLINANTGKILAKRSS